MQPIQIGVGVSGGAEAVVHATRRLMSSLTDNHVFAKLDFSNAFQLGKKRHHSSERSCQDAGALSICQELTGLQPDANLRR